MTTSDLDRGIEQARDMIPESVWAASASVPEGVFAPGLAELAMTNVYGRLWGREGLDRRSRSLVTLGLLIALRAGDELRINLLMALRNGLTREELEEVIYHATGYAGFPAAVHAARIATDVLGADGTTAPAKEPGSPVPADRTAPGAPHASHTTPTDPPRTPRATPRQ
ncbi:carboxymuconolactone decarboxylase family protein [Streptomyces sp. NPDC056716]|uniref:carboxymuconolactone decarboxylase family protein n=1 Tax=unclassified Streptomyces TaxID=2593676 RepID=UPI003681EDFB